MKFLKLTKIKRLIVLATTIVATILAITLGSSLYVSKNVKKSVEYGGGAEYVVQVQPHGSVNAASIATDVANSIYERVNPLGVNGADAEAQINGNDANIRVVYPGNIDENEKKRIEELITSKPQLVLTDFYGNPLFDKYGKFNTFLQTNRDPNGWANPHQTMAEFYSYDPTNPKPLETEVPISQNNGAKAEMKRDGNGDYQVSINLKSDDSATEWTKATRYISSLKGTDPKKPTGKNVVLAWLDPHKFIYKMHNWYHSTWNTIWGRASNPALGLGSMAKVFDDKTGHPTTSFTTIIPGDNYLISSASVKDPLTGRSFVIEGNFNSDTSKKLAQRINYGVANYSLKTKFSNIIQAQYGNSAFQKAMIAGIVVFAVIALVLMLNYGLLGALSTISIALFIFMTLAMFTVMRGEYSPAAIAALIIGIGMSVDANIITFERLKAEMYAGSSVKKAFHSSNKKSLSTIFDSNITTMIVAIVLFYFGTRSIIGLSVTLILSIVFTLLIMLLFTRFMSSMLINSDWVKNNKWLVGSKPKFDVNLQNKINKVDYIKASKWFALSSIIVALIGVIVFSITAGVSHSFTGGFNLSQEFSGGSAVVIKSGLNNSFTEANISAIKTQLAAVPAGDIIWGADAITVRTKTDLDINAVKTALEAINPNFEVIASNTTTDVANGLVKDALIAIGISIGAIIIYTLIRFKWTYSIAAIVALVHDAVIVVAAFAIVRAEISPIFVAALLSVIGYSINDTIVTFDRIREKASTHVGKLDKTHIRALANDAIRDTLKRSLLTSITTVIAVLILMSFGNATKFSFNLAMLVGLISGTYSSVFIATYLWTFLETKRQSWIEKRTSGDFWKVKGLEEQTVTGINDFTA